MQDEVSYSGVFVPCFVGIDCNLATFKYSNHLTSSDVMATTVTVTKLLQPNTSLAALKAANNLHRVKLPSPMESIALQIPRKRMHKILLAERDKFMKKLLRERTDREKLEHWAATKIQSIFRGHCCRPNSMPVYKRKQQINVVAAIRKDVSPFYMLFD